MAFWQILRSDEERIRQAEIFPAERRRLVNLYNAERAALVDRHEVEQASLGKVCTQNNFPNKAQRAQHRKMCSWLSLYQFHDEVELYSEYYNALRQQRKSPSTAEAIIEGTDESKFRFGFDKLVTWHRYGGMFCEIINHTPRSDAAVSAGSEQGDGSRTETAAIPGVRAAKGLMYVGKWEAETDVQEAGHVGCVLGVFNIIAAIFLCTVRADAPNDSALLWL
jgi:hypothetical protein